VCGFFLNAHASSLLRAVVVVTSVEFELSNCETKTQQCSVALMGYNRDYYVRVLRRALEKWQPVKQNQWVFTKRYNRVHFPAGNGNRLTLFVVSKRLSPAAAAATQHSHWNAISAKLKQLSPAVFIDDHWNERNGAAKNTLGSFVSRVVSHRVVWKANKEVATIPITPPAVSFVFIFFQLTTTPPLYSSPSAPDEGRQVIISEGRKIRDKLWRPEGKKEYKE